MSTVFPLPRTIGLHEEIYINAMEAAEPLRDAGFALHWLHPREKRPIGEKWSEAPVLSIEQLRESYRPGNNLGVRLGEPSAVAGGYLNVLDMDIRIADLKDEAWDALAEMFPDIDLSELPAVQSGSGGESRHLYLITDKPFRSKKLRTSEGKHRHLDKHRGREVWSYDWEIELFGTDKQVVMPPSIHPESGKPYIWLREFDFSLLDLGIGPFIPAAAIERLAVAEHTTYEFESRDPLTFSGDQLDRVLRDIPDDRIDDRVDWVTLGQALHHQFGGSDEGFELWMKHSARGSKFLAGSSRAKELRRYRGFGRNRRQPVTMASIVEWAKDTRIANLRASFDEDEDQEPEAAPSPPSHAAVSDDVDPFDAIGTATPPPEEVETVAAAGVFDDILGGDEEGDDDAEDDVDDIDAIGSNRPVKGQSKAVSGDWISLLDITENGAIKGTLHNVETLVRNDPRLVGLPQLNEFTLEPVQRRPPGTKANRRRNAAKATRQLSGPVWQVRDRVNGDMWSDDRDFAIRSILEAPGTQGGYGIKVTDRDLKAAIVLAASDNRFHPVREYLEGLTWDGASRVESLFIDYLGAADSPYARGVGRQMMVAAVARIFEPGHKADHVVILEGLQGKRKSTFIKVLARHWFAELDADFHDSKALVELMQGAWIMELPELSGFNRSDVRSIKAFVSRQRDKVRLAYARRAGEYPRQCIFIGSTNDREYLKDDTGGRRWWPIECSVASIDTDLLEQNVDQLWAEALALYLAMRAKQPHGTLPLYLSDEEAGAEALRVQESRRAETADEMLAGQIGAWLETPVATGDIEADERPALRNETCLAEIWRECLGKEAGRYSQADAQLIGRALRLVEGWESSGRFSDKASRWGKQRLWERGGAAGRLARAA